MGAFNPAITLKLSIQRALLSEVTERLVSVTCGIKGTVVTVRTYMKGSIEKYDIERLSFVAAQVIADFPDGYTIEDQCLSADDCEPQMLDFWAFMRKR
jgi:hypothetical protein